jgi:hypothetical protein
MLTVSLATAIQNQTVYDVYNFSAYCFPPDGTTALVVRGVESDGTVVNVQVPAITPGSTTDVTSEIADELYRISRGEIRAPLTVS